MTATKKKSSNLQTEASIARAVELGKTQGWTGRGIANFTASDAADNLRKIDLILNDPQTIGGPMLKIKSLRVLSMELWFFTLHNNLPALIFKALVFNFPADVLSQSPKKQRAFLRQAAAVWNDPQTIGEVVKTREFIDRKLLLPFVDATAPEPKPAAEDHAPLHKDDGFILDVLAQSHTNMIQVDIEAVTPDKGRPLSRKTIGKRLSGLKERGLVNQPSGNRGGWTITEKGRSLLPMKET